MGTTFLTATLLSVFLYLGVTSSSDGSKAPRIMHRLPRSNHRIVNGSDAKIGEWPWQVYIKHDESECAGSLISSEWVLTAAHCFNDTNAKNYKFIMGTVKRSGGWGAVTRRGKQLIIHPGYRGHGADIALVKLSKPVTSSKKVRPVCLPSPSIPFPSGKQCWVTGWGDIAYNVDLPLSKPLQKLMVPLIDHATCVKMYSSYKFNVEKDMMCAGYKEGKKDACQGDSGGALVCEVNGIWYEVGLVSWGNKCALPNYPGVYTNVSYYMSWIQLHIPTLTFGTITSPPLECAGNADAPRVLLIVLLLGTWVLSRTV